MNELLEKLHDIEGLDSVSMWPLTTFSWIVLIFGVITSIFAVIWLVRWVRFNRSWKKEAYRHLCHLEKKLSPDTSSLIVADLSECLRRIAFHQFTRNECAGLVGCDWLQWLTKHDPKKFNWENEGKLLIEVPYAKEGSIVCRSQTAKLIQAAKGWVN